LEKSLVALFIRTTLKFGPSPPPKIEPKINKNTIGKRNVKKIATLSLK
jgi:hypothetical protein